MAEAAGVVNKRCENYDKEYGTTDPETGAREYPGDGLEYVIELDEIADKILSARDRKVSL